MATVPAASSYSQHYLQIEALSLSTNPPSGQAAPVPQPLHPWQLTYLPVLIFFGVFLVGFLYAAKHQRQLFQNLNHSFKLALLAAITPLALSLIGTPTRLNSLADNHHTPQNFTIIELGASRFLITWETQEPTIGALAVSADLTQPPLYILTSNNADRTTLHSVTINSHPPESTLFISVFSEGFWYDAPNPPLQLQLSR